MFGYFKSFLTVPTCRKLVKNVLNLEMNLYIYIQTLVFFKTASSGLWPKIFADHLCEGIKLNFEISRNCISILGEKTVIANRSMKKKDHKPYS